MKKRILCTTAALIVALVSVAQERQPMNFDPGRIPSDGKVNTSAFHRPGGSPSATHVAAKATSSDGRWYSYADFMDRSEAVTDLITGVDFTDGYDLPIWADTLGIINYTSGPAHNTMVSIGAILDPKWFGFNRYDLYPDSIKITSTDAYVLDSVKVWGYYQYASSGVTDTLRIAVTSGDGGAISTDNIFPGGSISGGHYGSISFLDIAYDSVHNKMGGAMPYFTTDVLLHSPADTGAWENSIAVTPPISVTAGHILGMSASFQSGDAARSGSGTLTHLPGDTLLRAAAPYAKFNLFRPIIDFYTATDPSSSTVPPSWPPYVSANLNAGYFKNLPNDAHGWGGEYVPEWAWTSSGGGAASSLQMPYFWWHVTCTTCIHIPMSALAVSGTGALISSVSAYPNPANEEVAIHFELSQANDVRLTLTNMMGQVVATDNRTNCVNGAILINTASLPAGLYIYTIEAGGNSSVGRIAVAH